MVEQEKLGLAVDPVPCAGAASQVNPISIAGDPLPSGNGAD
jgi:hypothetical protein